MLTATSSEVVDFVAAYQENRNLGHASGPSGYRIVVVERRKYLAIDEVRTFEGQDCPGQSGRFLVDRATGAVYTIRGYGQRGHRAGMLVILTEQFRQGSRTFTPEARVHVERGHARVASWPAAQTESAGLDDVEKAAYDYHGQRGHDHAACMAAAKGGDGPYCEQAECGNPLTLDDIQAGDELCSYCVERDDIEPIAEDIAGWSSLGR
ncbi:MAG TPA: hypothetical protein VN886_17885 [Acidimicrobiales bacterium]|nr:hypothetical protein [Acidimicrobiales bacterium]